MISLKTVCKILTYACLISESVVTRIFFSFLQSKWQSKEGVLKESCLVHTVMRGWVTSIGLGFNVAVGAG